MQQYTTISYIASIIINERSFLFSDAELFLVHCCSRGKQYMFDIGKPVKFRGRVLNFLVGLMPDILKMIEDVVYSQDIISRNYIIDPITLS
jgi:hypothetical protein